MPSLKSIVALCAFLATPSFGWVLTTFADDECEGTPSASPNGVGNQACTAIGTDNKARLELSGLGNCQIILWDEDNCSDLAGFQDFFQNTDEARGCIEPADSWSHYEVVNC